MEFTPLFNFPCPDSTDYADLAIYMQSLAEKLETKIVAQRNLIKGADTQPVAVFNNSNAIGPLSTGSIAAFLNIDNIIFANYVVTPQGQKPTFIYSPGSLFIRSGLYLVGYNVLTNNTGAVTDGSKRKVYASVLRSNTSGTPTELMNITSEVAATSTANAEGFGSMGVVYLSDQDYSLSGVMLAFSHNDAASNVTIPIGGFVAFIQRIGSADLIEVT